jgi:hypothetical protein
MRDRQQLLEHIVGLARQLRDLERELVPSGDPKLVLARLKSVRQELDEALGDLQRVERD